MDWTLVISILACCLIVYAIVASASAKGEYDRARSEANRRANVLEDLSREWQEATNRAINADNAKLDERINLLEAWRIVEKTRIQGILDTLTTLQPKPAVANKPKKKGKK